ncbi:MAG: response regulator transcription factor, partial [Opitutaceae bacterium]
TPVKIVIVEDQMMIRDLLVLACQAAFARATVEQAADGAAALERCRAAPPELIILDLELPDGDGLNLMPELRRLAPSAKVIVLSSHTDEVTINRVMQTHVEGFVDKNSQPLEMLREAVQAVMNGRRYQSPVVRKVWEKLRDEPEAFTKILSDREQEILGMVGRGLTNSEIAERVDLRVVTVQNHRCNIMTKLGIHSTSHLIRYANEKGFTRLSTFLPEKK